MRKKRSIFAAVIALSLITALIALPACSCTQEVQRSQEKLEVDDSGVSSKGAETEPFYVLIVGQDTRRGTASENDPSYADGTGRSDTMMIARADPKTYQITLVTVPRDTQDNLSDGSRVKINERFRVEGIEGSLNAVEELTGVRPKYYIETTFVGFEDLVDDLGGITMNVPFDQSMTDIVSGKAIAYSSGTQDLDGAEALVYARERHKYADMGLSNQEAYRQSADRTILQTIVTKVLSDASKTQDVVELLYGAVDTNWNLEGLKATAKAFAEHADQVTFLKGTGPYDGDIDSETQQWLAYRDENTWREIMAVVDKGGDPNEVFAAPSL